VSPPRPRSEDLVVASDLHLVAGDPDLDDFCAFLAARGEDAGTVVLLGDVFAAWLARESLVEPHHRAVLDACAALRGRGTRVVLVEGNREFGAQRWAGRAFDSVADEFVAGPFDGRRWLLAHGDTINADDRAYRRWRALARSAAVQGAFGLLPPRAGRALVRRIERAMRGRSAGCRTRLPEGHLEAYARALAARGFGGGVVGHFHVEQQRRYDAGGARPFELVVLPDWRSTRRSLRLAPGLPPRFETWGPERPPAPAIVAIDEQPGRARVVLDRAPGVAAGEVVAIGSGHGPDVRTAHVHSVDDDDPRRLALVLEPGPALQVGDRLHARPGRSEPR
jgi:UDP-2,3-diacylglucosamine hydrolase